MWSSNVAYMILPYYSIWLIDVINCDKLTTGSFNILTHWGRVTHIYVSKLFILGSDNGLSPGRRQAII